MCAKRRSPKMIPPDYSLQPGVYPIIPIRTNLTGNSVIRTNDATIQAGNLAQDVELDLDFESNEVFDIMMLELDANMTMNAAPFTNASVMDSVVALCEDPDKIAVGTPLHLPVTFETDDSFVWFARKQFVHQTALDVPVITDVTQYRQYIFEQPWTVARNVRWLTAQFSTAVADFLNDVNLTVWGRRREASDAEFKAIIYRQRF